MKQLVNTKNGLEEIDVSLAECLIDVAKNWYKELHVEYETETGIKLHVLSSGVIFKKDDWQDDWLDKKSEYVLPDGRKEHRTLNVNYAKAMPTILDKKGQQLELNASGFKGLPVHRIVAEAFYGRDNIKGLEIHHRDNNALNNQLWNLIPLKKSDHTVITNEGKKAPK